MKREDRQKLYKLIEQWTRAEIASRLWPLAWPQAGDYYQESLEFRDQIRKLMFGSSDLVELGTKWGIVQSCNHARKERDDEWEFQKKRKRAKQKTKSPKRKA